jgi:LuxR family transcriptional regulator, maltose regulon positive regulatory protein
MHQNRAKTTPPRLQGVTDRNRLFGLLDDLQDYPVTWISAPAGSGKTTLVASYARSRSIPMLWYSVDETDQDAANFFYHMGEAAKPLKKGRAKPLPLLTPEYRPGIGIFTRNYFELLFGRMNTPSMIVIDNYQDVSEDAELQEIIKNGAKITPEGIRFIIISRKESPPALVSLKVGSILASIGWDDMRFTIEEIREMICLRRKDTISEDTVRHIYHSARGWAAAIVLMIGNRDKNISFETDAIGQSSIFDYFNLEVFNRIDVRTKEFLHTTALLPAVTPEIAIELTGIEESAGILSYLSRNHYFTERYGNEYRYHPLFKEFLLSMAEKLLTPEEIKSIRLKAGRFLLNANQILEAIDLLIVAGDWDTLIPVILEQAQILVSEGRNKTLEGWIEAVPEEIRLHMPWLLYWLGACKEGYTPKSYPLFSRAFELFQENNDTIGILLAWSGITNSICSGYEDMRLMDAQISWLDNYTKECPSFPSPEIECAISFAMTIALMARQPHHPGFRFWIERAFSLSSSIANSHIRFFGFNSVAISSMWIGDYARLAMVIEKMEIMAKTGGPLYTTFCYYYRSVFLNETDPYCKSLFPLVDEGIRICEEHGLSFLGGPNLMLERLYAAINNGDSLKAQIFIKELEGIIIGPPSLIQIRCHAASALYYHHTGNSSRALIHGEELLRVARELGAFYPEAAAHLYLSFILIEADRPGEAREHLDVYRAMPETPSMILKYTYLIAEAALALNEGSSYAPKLLRDALSFGRKEGYISPFYWWQPSLMVRLCRAALAWNIEKEHVQYIIRNRNLVPEELPVDGDNWPWPIKIYTLGTFRIMVNDEPIAFTGKVQKRPLSLLKTIIAMKGKDVRQDELEDMLWPEAEGDNARIAFKATLSRLRKLLGNNGAIEVSEGRVFLNNKSVWVDTWALGELTERILRLSEKKQHATIEETENLASLIINTYQGDFLSNDDEPWIIPYRDKLRSSFQRTVKRLGDVFNAVGASERIHFLNEYARNRGLTPEELEAPAARLSLIKQGT